MNGTTATRGRQWTVAPGWRATAWGSRQLPPAARRVVDQQSQELPLGFPQQRPPGQPLQPHRFPRLLPLMPTACCAAGRGSTAPGSAARLTASTASRTSAAASSVSASVASPRTNSLPFRPLILYTWLLIMSLLPLPSQTLAWLKHAADAGQCEPLVLLHLIARADKRDQDVGVFVNSYSKTIAALCRRLDALERGAKDLPAASTPPPTALVEVVGNELPLLPDGRVDEARTRAAIHKIAAWLDTRGQHGCSYLLREEIIDQ